MNRTVIRDRQITGESRADYSGNATGGNQNAGINMRLIRPSLPRVSVRGYDAISAIDQTVDNR